MTLKSVGADGNGLGIEFVRHSDRYAHRIYALEGNDRGELLLESQEGALDSPALQDLTVDAFAALVGMSGANHWSLTVEPQLVDGRPRLVFDAACRLKEPLARVTSCYEAVADGVVVEPLAVDRETASEIVRENRTICVVRKIAAHEAPPATVRWRYAVSLRQTA